MNKVRVELADRSYDIVVGEGVLAEAGPAVAPVCRGRKAVIVSNPVVAGLYADTLMESLRSSGFDVHLATVPAGEEFKTLDTVASLYRRFIEHKLDRSSVIFALGGGVVGDMAGFAAATYLRGVDVVQVPTTLLAQVDASVGGKTGVDLPQGKNLVGAFHQPKAVIMDTSTLRSLPVREFKAGLAEVVKYGIITDLAYFKSLESNAAGLLRLEADVLVPAIVRSVEIKADVVSRDEKETTSLRKTLNFGHTFAHSLETVSGYSEYLHGEAVAIGMVAACELSEIIGLAESGTSDRVAGILDSLGLPTSPRSSLDVDAVMQATTLDKKVANGKINFVLLRRIGEAVVTDEVPQQAVADVLRRWA